MDAFVNLYARHPLIFVHMIAALSALLVGAFQLWRAGRGDTGHRVWGWAWVLLMATATITSAFIRDYRMPNIAGFTPIHFFTLYVGVQLPMAVYNAKTGNIVAHKARMKGIFIGGCVIAGVFTLLPGRFLGQQLWHNLLGVI
ncbi:MAG: DUF2306 domain-containing protein [Burkholderiaceae bacterium]